MLREFLYQLVVGAVLILAVVPAAVYVSVKAGTFAYLMARRQFNEAYPREEEE